MFDQEIKFTLELNAETMSNVGAALEATMHMINKSMQVAKQEGFTELAKDMQRRHDGLARIVRDLKSTNHYSDDNFMITADMLMEMVRETERAAEMNERLNDRSKERKEKGDVSLPENVTNLFDRSE